MRDPEVPDVLRRIVARRRERIGEEAGGIPEPALGVAPLSPANNVFLAALAGRRRRAIIAEIKMGSPTLGSLEGRFDPAERARVYARAGAVALSVVVEPDFFQGSPELLAECRAASGLPALAKDFVVDVAQIEAAARAGATAVLLIAALLDEEELAGLASAARERGLAPLIETHDLVDIQKLEGRRWELVGVNNRDLRTFEVSLDHGRALATTLPAGSLKVAESGIRDRADVASLREVGYDAFLVGEALVTAEDPAAVLGELLA